MKFYYKTKDGHTGSTESVDSLPSDIRKLIVRRCIGGIFELPYVDELILDCNRSEIHNISFKCDRLSIYRPNIERFHVNYTWDDRYDQLHSTFNTLIRLKSELKEYAYAMFKNTLCTNIIPELDFTGVPWCSDAFKNTNIDNIPHNIKIPTEMEYVVFYKGSKIPQHKLLASDKLKYIHISKKGDLK